MNIYQTLTSKMISDDVIADISLILEDTEKKIEELLEKRVVLTLDLYESSIISTEIISKIVVNNSGINWKLIEGKIRRSDIIMARHVFCKLCTEYTSLTLGAIGELIGGRDHSSVIYARDNVDDSQIGNRPMFELYQKCKKDLNKIRYGSDEKTESN